MPKKSPRRLGQSPAATQSAPVSGWTGDTSRRRFLASASSAIVTGAAGARLIAQGKVAPNITGDTIQQAEEVIGVSFTDAERELFAGAVSTNRTHIDALRKVELTPDIEPALHFHPPAGARANRPPASRRLDVHVPIVEVRTPPSPEDLAFCSVMQLSRLIETRQVSSSDLTRLYLERLERFNRTLQCVVTFTRELAFEQAAQADREIAAGHYRGPLHGVPYGVKDLAATRGIRTTWGAKPYEQQVFDFDATVVERLREAGAVLLAKLTSGELAVGDIWFGGRTRNPWKPERGSGGSSAGPASATAAGLVAFAIGTETNGSIVSPASQCGVTGLRPTYGRVSRHGFMALRWTMDKVGAIARTAEDCALVLGAIYGPDGRDGTVADVAFEWTAEPSLAGLRVGVVEAELLRPAPDATEEERARHAERRALIEDAIDVLRRAGATTEAVTLPDLPVRAMYAICNAEAGAAFDELVRSGAVRQLADKGPGGRANQLRWSRFIPAVDYLRAQRLRTLLVGEVDRLLTKVDVFVSPTDSASLAMTNFTGHPAMTVPVGMAAGLPAGVMLTGRHYDEATLLRVAWAFQQRTDWHRARPSPLA